MATATQWVEGARPRTLPNAVAPVLAGTGAALSLGSVSPGRALLALLVALALVIGVNYANDYSDGVRGTDADRVGPLRLVGSGVAEPAAVRGAAFVSFGVAAVAGVALVASAGRWWLLAVGAGCIAGAWFYTGGRRPYGYAGLGEVAVFLFFGPVAVLGTQYVLADRVTPTGAAVAVAVGAFSSAVLVANNLRDRAGDAVVGKRTLAVALGDRRTRVGYAMLVGLPLAVTLILGVQRPVLLVGLLAAPLVVLLVRRVLGGAQGRALIPALRDTGLAMLLWAALTGAALAL